MSSKNIYANTVAEYQARSLFGSEKLRRIADADFSDAVRILIGYGYFGDYDTSVEQDIDNFIVFQIRKLAEFIEENSASDALSKILLNGFIYSDAKVLFKSRFTNGNISSALYFDGVTHNSTYIQEVISELGDKPSGKAIDYVFTKAMFSDNLSLAIEIGKSLVLYCKRQIDITNILSAYRANKLGYSYDETMSELFYGGEIDLETVVSADELKNTKYEEAMLTLELGDIQKFRGLTEKILTDTLKNDFADYMSYGPFIKYILAQLEEFRAVRYILICIKNNIHFSVDDFRSIDDD